MFKIMLIVGAGGFIGSCLRYLLGRCCQHIFPSLFPWGTFAVNLAGCFLIGIFFGWMEKQPLVSSHIGLFLITGCCGGFTTFSAFSSEVLQLLQSRQWTYLSLYLAGSIMLGVFLVWLGRYIIKLV